MSSLAELPELVGFFSYSREDDEAFKGTLSALRDGIQRELSAQLGRSKRTFRLWQDQVAIAPGKLWESEIKTAIDESFFFIPIVTPRSVSSKYCKFEFEAFLAREKAIGRSDLIFPILYISVAALENEAKWRDDPVLSTIGRRQYVDWRPLRHLDVQTTAVREQIERLCQKIVEALNAPWTSPEERQRMEEAKARQQAEEEARRLEAEAKRRAEEEQHRKASGSRSPAARRGRGTPAGGRGQTESGRRSRRQAEAKARQQAEEEARRLEAETKRRAQEEQRQAEAKARQQAEEEARRLEAETKRRAQEEQRQAEAKARQQAEEEARRLEAETKRRAQEEQRQAEAKARQQAEEEARRLEAEAKRRAKKEQRQAEVKARQQAEETRRRQTAEAEPPQSKQAAEALALVARERNAFNGELAEPGPWRVRVAIGVAAVAVLLLVGWGGYALFRNTVERQAERKLEQVRQTVEADANRKVMQRTAAEAEAKRNADQQAKAAAEAEAKRNADQRAKAAAEAEAKRNADQQAKAAAEAEAKRKSETTGSIPKSSAATIEQRARDFALYLEFRWSKSNVEVLAGLDAVYEDEVMYFGKKTKKDVIIRDKQAFAQQWPQREYKPKVNSVLCSDSVCAVHGVVEFRSVDPVGKIQSTGVAKFEYQLVLSGTTVKVRQENGETVSRTRTPLDARETQLIPRSHI